MVRSAKSEESAVWIGSVVIDCTDFARMMEFWRKALRYAPRDPPGEGFVVLKDPHGQGPNVSISLRPGLKPNDRHRLHLDLYSSDPDAEVERLLHLGATARTTFEKSREKGRDYITLSDPEGNLFDVVDKRGWRLGQRVAKPRR